MVTVVACATANEVEHRAPRWLNPFMTTVREWRMRNWSRTAPAGGAWGPGTVLVPALLDAVSMAYNFWLARSRQSFFSIPTLLRCQSLKPDRMLNSLHRLIISRIIWIQLTEISRKSHASIKLFRVVDALGSVEITRSSRTTEKWFKIVTITKNEIPRRTSPPQRFPIDTEPEPPRCTPHTRILASSIESH